MSKRVLLGALALCCAQSAWAEDAYLRLRCEGDAAGAQVTINGARKGECPIDLAVPEGKVSVVVRKDLDPHRFRLFEKELFLPAGGMKRETVVLGPVQFTPEGQRLEDERIAQQRVREQAEAAERAAALEEQQRRAAKRAEYGDTNRYLGEMSGKVDFSQATAGTTLAPIALPFSTLSDVLASKKLCCYWDDPAVFGNPDAMVSQAAQQSGGVGISILMLPYGMQVNAVLPGKPAALAGVQVADVITHIDGQPMAGLSLLEGIGRMRGQPGTPVQLTVVRSGVPSPITLNLVRVAID